MRQARTIIPAFYLEAFAESTSGLGILSRASRFDELWRLRYKFGAAEIARKIDRISQREKLHREVLQEISVTLSLFTKS